MRLRTVLEKQRSLVFEMADRAVTEAPDSLVSQALSYFQRATLRSEFGVCQYQTASLLAKNPPKTVVARSTRPPSPANPSYSHQDPEYSRRGVTSNQIASRHFTATLGVLAKLLVGFEYSPRSSGVNVTQSSAFRLEMAELGWHLAELMLQETVKRKLEGARSPLNGEQQNGVCDGSFSPTSKRIRKDVPGIEAINSLPNNLPLPAVSPLQQLDMKAPLPLQNSGTHGSGLDDLGKNGGLAEIKLPVNGCNELDDSFNILQNKELKQEPLDDPSCIDTSETSLSNQNKLFSDINLNDQEWQELIDELANTVPEDDIQDLFNEDFEEKKEPEFPRPATDTQENASVKSDPSHSPFAHVPLGSPQVRPSSSGPPFSNVSTASSIASASSAPPAPVPAGSPANCVVQSPQTPSQAHTPGQTQNRSGNGYLINPAAATVPGSGPGPVNIPSADLSPAEQLKQMAAQQQQRAKLMQQKQQQQQHPNQASSWSPVGPPSSPYGGPFSADKPNSPMMYPQAFNNQNPIVPPMANNPQKTTINNYLPQNHMNMISQQPNNLGTNSLSKQPNMLSYGNTKPLTHFNAELSQRMTPPMANPGKNPMMPYLQQQQSQQPQMQAQMAHLSEEQKRMLIMKQKGMMNQPMAYAALSSLGQVSASAQYAGNQKEANTKA
ncbi:Maml3 [Columba guinea]|nr:Maml3 [Columba guinea]